MHLSNSSYSELPANIHHILPKANQIVQIDEQVKRTIYPYKIKHMKHNIQSSIDTLEEYKPSADGIRFIPPKQTVISHFSPQLIIYDKFSSRCDGQFFNTNIFSIQKLKNLRNNDYVMHIDYVQPYHRIDTLTFDSRFESGNLSIVSKVDDLYCLLLHNDVNTSGYTNWFYFSVKCNCPGTYRFAIMNYGKAGWPYNAGIGICTYSQQYKKWRRDGSNIQCISNRKIFTGNSYLNNFNTLYFEYEFANEQTYFAYNIPYTYTELCMFLDEIQQRKLPFFYRKLAGRTLAGNRLEMLTVANYQASYNDMAVVIMIGRSHPGETVSSWVIKSFIEFIISDDPSAKLLRDNYIFKICPMINPDGVIHGNYRCSLSGRDLNRRWTKPSKDLYPQVYYIKNQIIQISKNRTIKMILDMHGHSQKKKTFVYGCNDRFQPHRCRLFPYMMSKVSQHFQFNFCNFAIDKSKLSTARVNLHHTLKLIDVFTLQSSQYGIYLGHINHTIMKQIGISIAKAFVLYFKPKSNLKGQMDAIVMESQKLQQQLLQSEQLLQSGNNADSGSQKQPSVDNIGFDRLAKMTQKKQNKLKFISTPQKKINKNNQIHHINHQKNNTFIIPHKKQKNRVILTSDGIRNQYSYRQHDVSRIKYQRQKIQSTSFIKRDQLQLSKRKQVLKMINFSLSINDSKNNFGNFITKLQSKTPSEFQCGQTMFIYNNLVKNKSKSSKHYK